MEVSKPHEESMEFDPNSNENSPRLLDVLKFSVLNFVLDGADKVLKDPRTLKNHLHVSNGIALQEYHLDSNENGTEDGNSSMDTNRVHGGNVFEGKTKRVRNSLQENERLLRIWGAAETSVTSAVSKRVKAQKSIAVRIGFAFFKSIYVCSMLVGLLASGFILGGFMMRKLVEKPIHTREILNFDYSKASPVAFVPIMSSGVGNPSSLLSKVNLESGKPSSTRTIPYNHKLQLTVSLTVPESEHNQNLGVFQVRVEFLSANGNVTASSSHPCMLRFKSLPIRLAQTLLKSAPLVAGFQSESQILNIHMTEFTEGLEPTACLRVILEQRAEYEPGKGIPQIYAAYLDLESELPKLKRFIWCWRRTLFIWSSMISFLTELVIILAFFRPIIVPRRTCHVRKTVLRGSDQ
ncbi:hypothetical protein FEM48_Zijuj12G0117800 [Ziziphus jujuba var. spinosa]|uniref:Seipin-2-like n=1 Tax=Ziziphus jujuba var. spinosa TaxID=714518 RepID=A0A978UD50_ZIZJJ|nr:hypothetical protein FEM48_Zijuj12G0117800 [Ziziphus jujuba var. spinosa]